MNSVQYVLVGENGQITALPRAENLQNPVRTEGFGVSRAENVTLFNRPDQVNLQEKQGRFEPQNPQVGFFM